MYADDTSIVVSSGAGGLQEIVCGRFDHVYRWFCQNKLTLNPDKSNYVVFHAGRDTGRDLFAWG